MECVFDMEYISFHFCSIVAWHWHDMAQGTNIPLVLCNIRTITSYIRMYTFTLICSVKNRSYNTAYNKFRLPYEPLT